MNTSARIEGYFSVIAQLASDFDALPWLKMLPLQYDLIVPQGDEPI
ncbi:hypothetical protein ACT9ST_09750 [Sphingobium limneticum]